jgi:hypothetical protein
MFPRPRVVHYPFDSRNPLSRAVKDAVVAERQVVVICGNGASAAVAAMVVRSTLLPLPPNTVVHIRVENGGQHYRGRADVSLVLLANDALRRMHRFFAEVVLPALLIHDAPPLRVVGDLERVFTPEELEMIDVEEPGATHLPK